MACPHVVYLNHASWWDPLVCLTLWDRRFRHLTPFAPIDSNALEKYRFFRRLGFYGVEPDSRRGAATFLNVSLAILNRPSTLLWVTPQARFADVRERPLALRPGLGHLASRLSRSLRTASESSPGIRGVRFVPLAIEYTWWHERTPEILIRFGTPVEVTASGPEAADWTRRWETELEKTMDTLASEARRRDPDGFEPVLDGRAGVGLGYDLWRRVRATVRGQTFDKRHGSL